MIGNIQSIKFKEEQVNELVEKIKSSKTFMIVSVKGLPSKQFQEIKKSIREEALVKITKKNIILRALEKCGKESINPLKDYVDSDIALVLSHKDGYDLARILAKKKTKVFAKAGQIAVTDIEINEGPTDLVPGPAISELGTLGIRIAVESGKISIKSSKVIVKKGEIIKENVASILQRLNILPFKVELKPIIIYDVKSGRINTQINIDPEFYTQELKTAMLKSIGFAQIISFYCKETNGYLLAKVYKQGEAMKKLIKEKD